MMKRWLLATLTLFIGMVLIGPTEAILAQSGAQDRARLETPFFDPDSSFIDGCETLFGGTVQEGTLESYIDAVGQISFDVGKAFGLPYEALIAQSAHESAWGQSGLTRNANNFFGVKAGDDWDGLTYSADTWEEIDGRRVEVQGEQWRAYATPLDAFVDYAYLITELDRYSAALNYPSDPYAYIEAVWQGGFATDSQYVQKLSRTIDAVISYIDNNDLFPPSSAVEHDNNPWTFNRAEAAYCDNPGQGRAASQIIAIAEQELAKSPQQWDANVMKYTLGAREPWCANFVSWVYKEAGVPFSGGWREDWQLPAVLGVQAWFQAGTNGSEYFRVGERMPQPGDVAFYIGAQTPDRNSARHVNIVISVDGSTNTMVTIGGNESNTVRKTTRDIRMGAQSLVGFGRLAQ